MYNFWSLLVEKSAVHLKNAIYTIKKPLKIENWNSKISVAYFSIVCLSKITKELSMFDINNFIKRLPFCGQNLHNRFEDGFSKKKTT